MVFLEFWEPGDITNWDESHKILTCMHFMKGFGLGAVIGLKETTSYQVAQWTFGKFLVPLGIPKIIVVDADGLFLEFSRILFKKS